jgi:aconitate hydratase
MGSIAANHQFQDSLLVNKKRYHFFSINKAKQVIQALDQPLPYTINLLLEGLLRHFGQHNIDETMLAQLADWKQERKQSLFYFPYRILMQDFTGIASIVDLVAMKDAMQQLGDNPDKIDLLRPTELVVDHSISVDFSGIKNAPEKNKAIDYKRNLERYALFKWAKNNFNNFTVIPPGKGICHQVNLEHLARVVVEQEVEDKTWLFPDTLVGTDSHTTMINALGILGWGVGGIEAEAAILGQPIAMSLPKITGICLQGRLPEGIHGTDLVLSLTRLLRKTGVVGNFIEFYGPGMQSLTLPQRATIANMCPEFGATCAYFPIDQETVRYLSLTGKTPQQCAIIEHYAKAQGLWHDPKQTASRYNESISFDLTQVEHVIAGPKRPQDSVVLSQVPKTFSQTQKERFPEGESNASFPVIGKEYSLPQGAVVIAAITSCTNTSNPNVLIAAAIIAKKAYALGLTVQPWVKTSMAPGSRVVTKYLEQLGLMRYLEALGFHVVGYGCTTCIGNSGPLDEAVAGSIRKNDIMVASVLSGNRNFEGRIHPLVQTNWLASPPLVIAYALAGKMTHDLTNEPLGKDKQGKPIFLADLWPTNQETEACVKSIKQTMFVKEYKNINQGGQAWDAIVAGKNKTYPWNEQSTYIRKPPFFNTLSRKRQHAFQDLCKARILLHLDDSITTDHISPAGSIKKESPAGKYLKDQGIEEQYFNSYGSRRGNHEVMMRGTFANIRIRNKLVPQIEGGFTKHFPSNKVLSVYDAAMAYMQEKVPLVVFAGAEYGSGSSRDWAAKGPMLLGVKCIIAKSFERIHRTNLICMGIIPCQIIDLDGFDKVSLQGDEIIDIVGLNKLSDQHKKIQCHITTAENKRVTLELKACIDTKEEIEYALCGGILHHRILSLLDQPTTEEATI